MQDWNLRWIGRENRSREVWSKEKRKILTEIYYLMIGRDDGGDDQDNDNDDDDGPLPGRDDVGDGDDADD